MKSLDYWEGANDVLALIHEEARTWASESRSYVNGLNVSFTCRRVLVNEELTKARNVEVDPWFDVKANWKLPSNTCDLCGMRSGTHMRYCRNWRDS